MIKSQQLNRQSEPSESLIMQNSTTHIILWLAVLSVMERKPIRGAVVGGGWQTGMIMVEKKKKTIT